MKKLALLVCCVLLSAGCSYLPGQSTSKGVLQAELIPPLAQLWDHPFETVSEDYVTVTAVAIDPANSGGWYAAGSINRLESREEAPYVLHSTDGTGGERIELPSNEATLGRVYDLHVTEEQTTAVGYLVRDGIQKPVFWTLVDDSWQLGELSFDGQLPQVEGISDNGEFMYGTTQINSRPVPQVWKRDGDSWNPLPVDVGEPSEKIFISSLQRIDDQTVLGVGWRVDENVRLPIFWRDESGTIILDEPEIENLPETGYFTDLATTPEGHIFAVGSGSRLPLIAKRLPGEESWQASTLRIDFDGNRDDRGGQSFSDIDVFESTLFVSFENDFLQDPITSSDFGETWEFTNLIRSRVIPQGVRSLDFDASSSTLLLAGDNTFVRRSNDSWEAVQHNKLPIGTNTAFARNIHVVNETLTLTGSALTTSGQQTTPTPHVWTGSLETGWEGQAVGDSQFETSGSATNGEQLAITSFSPPGAGSSSASLNRPDSAVPVLTASPNRETIRIVYNTVLMTEDGTSLFAGREHFSNEDQAIVPTFHLAEPDGEVQSAPLNGELALEGSLPLVVCISGSEDNYTAVIQDELLNTQLATSTDGRSWQLLGVDKTLEASRIRGCAQNGDDFTLWGSSPDEVPFVASSDDLQEWSQTQMGETNDQVFSVVSFGDQLFALGSATDGPKGKTTGFIWYERNGEWLPITNNGGPLGFEPDAFSTGTSIRDAVEYQDQIVFFGTDRDRAGLWAMPTDTLIAAAAE